MLFVVDIHQYLTSETEKALVLVGESGIGKTSLVAKAASMTHKWMANQGKGIQQTVILRFCGTSPGSCTIRQLLMGLCHQIAYTAGDYRHEIPKDYKELRRHFMNLISYGNFDGHVVIFLDAIDQLSPADDAFRLGWLPAKIANNVKVILSTLSSESNILDHLHNKINDEQQFIKVGVLKPTECETILQHWLDQNKRLVTPLQWEFVKIAFQHCSAPLYLKVKYGHSVWRH